MDSFVTLIVKAPNQQIEDQTIKCEPSWTIQKLKQHLSEVYPSKPPRQEQRLIYSGQLLNDSATLEEVLRQYEGQDTHTVHLVCSSKYMNSIPETKPISQPSTPNNVQNSPSTSSTSSNPTTSSEQNQSNVPPTMPYFNVNSGPVDPNQYAMQLAWMQQAYFQYMAQYMQLAANSYGALPQGIPNTGEPAANPAEQPPAAAEIPAVARDPDNPERDWLEVFYMLTRATVLFIVIYFYSSPIRFLFVFLLGVGLYLYQIGFFRNMNHNNNHINGPPEQAQEEEAAPSRFMIVWTFFATFFASLIPEIPNPI
ncbi:homocysteine-responsive endoplasmic reticulum-resident ubiquitin-like domain member 2 protein [Diorhabda sublineata]|uniref:homocysteine-responsive endoplasmic reticulum-resident ubiquitin-like domain member 2 protein n=1 Tax=Diorhabda sublineata TaxID=1163346 RepID=UPI0024E10B8D|nr:homocysteine-responsive endoplasmic reticulum-resident ubiquitin-like domain member 2 protein [Diorhabda sublineata]